MSDRGTRGAYRKEERVQLPPQLQRELVEKAAARYGNCQGLAKLLNIPKSSVHYYLVGRLTIPVSVLESMLQIANDPELEAKVREAAVTKDRIWAIQYAQSVYRDSLIAKLRLPSRDDIEKDIELRRKAAAIVSYVMAEGSIWLQRGEWGEHAVNITFAAHETDLYEHFRSLVRDVFYYEMGPPQLPGNGAVAIRGFIYTRFIAEWLAENGVPIGEKSSKAYHLPPWVMSSNDRRTLISALQPWCDGEGSVVIDREGRLRFSVAQSRHTDLDLETVSIHLAHRTPVPTMYGRAIGSVWVFGVPLKDYCRAMFRSTVLDDVHRISVRLDLDPRTRLRSMNLMSTGFWSCGWMTMFRDIDTLALVRMGVITQQRKVRAVLLRSKAHI